MKKSILAFVFLFLAFNMGCSTVKIERPEPITLADALKQIIDALNEMSKIQADAKHGLVPDEATVVFSITAGKKKNESASIEVVPTGIVKEISGLSYGWTSDISESRGNTITIKLRSILFSKDTELISKKSPEEITEMYETLKKLGWNIRK